MHLATNYPTYLYVFEESNMRVVCPIAERKYRDFTDIVTPYGFSGFISNKPYSKFSDYWDKFTQKKKYICGFFTINPLLYDQHLFSNKIEYRYNDLFIINLSLSSKNLFRNLSTNRKRQLKNFSKVVKNIYENKNDLIDFFLDNYQNFFIIRNANSLFKFSEDAMTFLLSNENVHLYGIKDGEKVTAVSVFATTRYTSDYLFNISLPEGRPYSAALIWYATLKMKSLGVRYLNLGGGVTQNDNIAEFKRRFGAEKYPLKSIKQVYNTDVYKQLCGEINANPNDYSGYFPAYHDPKLNIA
jgi:hypothetical protein